MLKDFNRAERLTLVGATAAVIVLSAGTAVVAPTLLTSITGQSALALLGSAIVCIALLGRTLKRVFRKNRLLVKTSGAENHAAMHDPLTGVANRRQFEQRLEAMVKDPRPKHVLLMLDLDRFKPVNDLYGHAAGDALLIEISAGLSKIVTPRDTVARLGGDEFAILLNSTNAQVAEAVSVRALEFVKHYRLDWEGHRVTVGTSIGVVHIAKPGLKTADLMAAADEALYAAKEAGRGVAFLAVPETTTGQPSTFTQLGTNSGDTFQKARPAQPARKEQHTLMASVIASAMKQAPNSDTRSGSRSRHSIDSWLLTEPRTSSNAKNPELQKRELYAEAAGGVDGGAELARWVFSSALHAAATLESKHVDHVGFVLPIPAQAVISHPALGEELMRINALSTLPLRHAILLLVDLTPDHDIALIQEFQQRMAASEVGLAYEIRTTTLDVLTPLQKVSFDEVYLSPELTRNLRPSTSAHAAIEFLVNTAKQRRTRVVAGHIDSHHDAVHLAGLGIYHFSGPFVGKAEPLPSALAKLSSNRKPGPNEQQQRKSA